MELIYLIFILVLSVFLGFELISKVPATLHTPLMSGANAISGITLVGAVLAAGSEGLGGFADVLAGIAVITATVNVVGGYMVTNRMLSMFKKKESSNGAGK
ncbi:MAG: NAD(P) transhydrogenase subunit alpha [Pseudomonadales bacterium]